MSVVQPRTSEMFPAACGAFFTPTVVQEPLSGEQPYTTAQQKILQLFNNTIAEGYSCLESTVRSHTFLRASEHHKQISSCVHPKCLKVTL